VKNGTAFGTILAAIGLFILVGVAATAQSPPEGASAPVGKISGRVVHAGTGKPVPGATVRVQKQAAQTDGSGRFSFDNVPAGNWVLSSEATVSEGGFLGIGARKARYWGFVTEWSEAGKETSVAIKLTPHGEVESTCRACHPDRATRALPVKRCLHRSGGELPAEMSAQVGRYLLANEKAKQQGKENFAPIPLETRKRPDGSTFQVYTCESCHSPHATTPYKRYIIAPYLERSVLCEGCHT